MPALWSCRSPLCRGVRSSEERLETVVVEGQDGFVTSHAPSAFSWRVVSRFTTPPLSKLALFLLTQTTFGPVKAAFSSGD